MYTVPPAPHDDAPDFWYIYRGAMKRFGWIFIGIHLLLLWLAYFSNYKAKDGGFFPDGVVMVFFIAYSFILFVFDITLIRISLTATEMIFQKLNVNINTQSYVVISSIISVVSIIVFVVFSMKLSDREMRLLGVYIPSGLYFLYMVIVPVFKLEMSGALIE